MIAVNFLRLTQSPTRVLSILMFSLLFLIGYWIGHGISRQVISSNVTYPANLSQDDLLPVDEQVNILVISVDHREGETPTLRSVWLVVYLPDESEAMFLPVFPKIVNDEARYDDNLTQAFTIDQDGIPGVEFFDTLQKRFKWDHFIVVEDKALIQAIDMIGGVFLNGRTQQGQQALETLHLIREDPNLLLLNESAAITSACQKVSISERNDLKSQFKKLSNQLTTDADLSPRLNNWLSWSDGSKKLRCEFPTIVNFSPKGG